MRIEDTTDRSHFIEHRINELRVEGRMRGLDDPSNARISWADFAKMVSRLGCRVEETADAKLVWVWIYTAGGRVMVSPDRALAPGDIEMDIGLLDIATDRVAIPPPGLTCGVAK